jgi:hypothetical protein
MTGLLAHLEGAARVQHTRGNARELVLGLDGGDQGYRRRAYPDRVPIILVDALIGALAVVALGLSIVLLRWLSLWVLGIPGR